jgi:hypothetical protein
MIKQPTPQKNKIMNIYAPNIAESKSRRQILTELRGEMNIDAIILGTW